MFSLFGGRQKQEEPPNLAPRGSGNESDDEGGAGGPLSRLPAWLTTPKAPASKSIDINDSLFVDTSPIKGLNDDDDDDFDDEEEDDEDDEDNRSDKPDPKGKVLDPEEQEWRNKASALLEGGYGAPRQKKQPEPDKPTVINRKKRVLMLLTSTPKDRFQKLQQGRALALLREDGVLVEIVDSADPKAAELMRVSGNRKEFPQLFLVDPDGKSMFFGNFDMMEGLHEAGMLGTALGAEPVFQKAEVQPQEIEKDTSDPKGDIQESTMEEPLQKEAKVSSFEGPATPADQIQPELFPRRNSIVLEAPPPPYQSTSEYKPPIEDSGTTDKWEQPQQQLQQPQQETSSHSYRSPMDQDFGQGDYAESKPPSPPSSPLAATPQKPSSPFRFRRKTARSSLVTSDHENDTYQYKSKLSSTSDHSRNSFALDDSPRDTSENNADDYGRGNQHNQSYTNLSPEKSHTSEAQAHGDNHMWSSNSSLNANESFSRLTRRDRKRDWDVDLSSPPSVEPKTGSQAPTETTTSKESSSDAGRRTPSVASANSKEKPHTTHNDEDDDYEAQMERMRRQYSDILSKDKVVGSPKEDDISRGSRGEDKYTEGRGADDSQGANSTREISEHSHEEINRNQQEYKGRNSYHPWGESERDTDRVQNDYSDHADQDRAYAVDDHETSQDYHISDDDNRQIRQLDDTHRNGEHSSKFEESNRDRSSSYDERQHPQEREFDNNENDISRGVEAQNLPHHGQEHFSEDEESSTDPSSGEDEDYEPKPQSYASRASTRNSIPGQSAKKILLVITQEGKRWQLRKQSRSQDFLDEFDLEYEVIDDDSDRREELLEISMIRRQFPQFFLVESDGSITFFGTYESLEELPEAVKPLPPEDNYDEELFQRNEGAQKGSNEPLVSMEDRLVGEGDGPGPSSYELGIEKSGLNDRIDNYRDDNAAYNATRDNDSDRPVASHWQAVVRDEEQEEDEEGWQDADDSIDGYPPEENAPTKRILSSGEHTKDKDESSSEEEESDHDLLQGFEVGEKTSKSNDVKGTEESPKRDLSDIRVSPIQSKPASASSLATRDMLVFEDDGSGSMPSSRSRELYQLLQNSNVKGQGVQGLSNHDSAIAFMSAQQLVQRAGRMSLVEDEDSDGNSSEEIDHAVELLSPQAGEHPVDTANRRIDKQIQDFEDELDRSRESYSLSNPSLDVSQQDTEAVPLPAPTLPKEHPNEKNMAGWKKWLPKPLSRAEEDDDEEDFDEDEDSDAPKLEVENMVLSLPSADIANRDHENMSRLSERSYQSHSSKHSGVSEITEKSRPSALTSTGHQSERSKKSAKSKQKEISKDEEAEAETGSKTKHGSYASRLAGQSQGSRHSHPKESQRSLPPDTALPGQTGSRIVERDDTNATPQSDTIALEQKHLSPQSHRSAKSLASMRSKRSATMQSTSNEQYQVQLGFQSHVSPTQSKRSSTSMMSKHSTQSRQTSRLPYDAEQDHLGGEQEGVRVSPAQSKRSTMSPLPGNSMTFSEPSENLRVGAGTSQPSPPADYPQDENRQSPTQSKRSSKTTSTKSSHRSMHMKNLKGHSIEQQRMPLSPALSKKSTKSMLSKHSKQSTSAPIATTAENVIEQLDDRSHISPTQSRLSGKSMPSKQSTRSRQSYSSQRISTEGSYQGLNETGFHSSPAQSRQSSKGNQSKPLTSTPTVGSEERRHLQQAGQTHLSPAQSKKSIQSVPSMNSKQSTTHSVVKPDFHLETVEQSKLSPAQSKRSAKSILSKVSIKSKQSGSTSVHTGDEKWYREELMEKHELSSAQSKRSGKSSSARENVNTRADRFSIKPQDGYDVSLAENDATREDKTSSAQFSDVPAHQSITIPDNSQNEVQVEHQNDSFSDSASSGQLNDQIRLLEEELQAERERLKLLESSDEFVEVSVNDAEESDGEDDEDSTDLSLMIKELEAQLKEEQERSGIADNDSGPEIEFSRAVNDQPFQDELSSLEEIVEVVEEIIYTEEEISTDDAGAELGIDEEVEIVHTEEVISTDDAGAELEIDEKVEIVSENPDQANSVVEPSTSQKDLEGRNDFWKGASHSQDRPLGHHFEAEASMVTRERAVEAKSVGDPPEVPHSADMHVQADLDISSPHHGNEMEGITIEEEVEYPVDFPSQTSLPVKSHSHKEPQITKGGAERSNVFKSQVTNEPVSSTKKPTRDASRSGFWQNNGSAHHRPQGQHFETEAILDTKPLLGKSKRTNSASNKKQSGVGSGKAKPKSVGTKVKKDSITKSKVKDLKQAGKPVKPEKKNVEYQHQREHSYPLVSGTEARPVERLKRDHIHASDQVYILEQELERLRQVANQLVGSFRDALDDEKRNIRRNQAHSEIAELEYELRHERRKVNELARKITRIQPEYPIDPDGSYSGARGRRRHSALDERRRRKYRSRSRGRNQRNRRKKGKDGSGSRIYSWVPDEWANFTAYVMGIDDRLNPRNL